MTVAFPDIKSFADLFTGAAPFAGAGKSPRLMRFRGWDGRGWCNVDGYVHSSDAPSLTVTGVTDRVKTYLTDNMLHVPNDSLYFEIVRYPDGTALVIAKHNAIIGSRWLALIDAATVPTFSERVNA